MLTDDVNGMRVATISHVHKPIILVVAIKIKQVTSRKGIITIHIYITRL